MSANCDYVYIEGLRFRTEGVRLYLALEDGSADGASELDKKEYRLVKGGPAATDLEKGVVSTGTLRERVSWRGKLRAQVLGTDGHTMAVLQLDPRRCEGRSGRKAFSPERLTESLGDAAIAVAREQLRTLPYGKTEVRAARKRLEWALTVIPDGEAGLMALTDSAPFLAGVLAAGPDLDILKKRPRDVALLLAVLPVLTATLELSAEEAREFELSLLACAESLPPMYRSKVSSFGGSTRDSAFGHTCDTFLLGNVVRRMSKDESTTLEKEVRHDLVLGALDRLGQIYSTAAYESQTRRQGSFVYQVDLNRKYASLFGGASPSSVRENARKEIAKAAGALTDPELLSRALRLELFSNAAFEALEEDGVRGLLERLRSMDPTGETVALVAAGSPSQKIRDLAAANA